MERKVLSQPNYGNALSFPTVTATQQRRRRQFSNHQLSTTQLSPPQPKNNSKTTQKQLKMNSNPIRKPIPNPTQNQPKTKSTQNQPIIIIFIINIIFSLPCSFRTVKKKKKKKEMQRLEGWYLCVRESSSWSAAREEKNKRKVLLEH